MRIKRILWLVIMACLGLSLYTVVLSRSETQEEKIIFGGADTIFVGAELTSYSDPNAEEIIEDDGLDWPDIDITLPQYSLVNSDNLLSSAYEPDLALKEDGVSIAPIYGTGYQAFDVTAKPYLEKMLKDMEALGFTPYVASAYRTYSYQAQLFNTKAFGIFLEMGYTWSDYDKYFEDGTEVYNAYQEAAKQAKKYTAAAGASEHQLALAVDLWDRERSSLGNYTYLNEDFRNWLEEHSWEYGFIQRYPTKKLLRTGWDEPWHYRYVGVTVAKFIKENDICYEEFYAHYTGKNVG